MQRKPGFPVANCSIKIPDGMPPPDPLALEDEGEHIHRRQQLINFGHAQWGFNNWSWSVTKQDLDFVDFANGKFCAGVVAFVSVTVKSFDIHRENIGYATSLAPNKGAAIYKSRKCAVTNALRETLLSFGGSVATELMELLETHKTEIPVPVTVAVPPTTAPSAPAPTPIPAPELQIENNQNITNKQEPKNPPLKNMRKDSSDSGPIRSPHPAIKNVVPPNVGNPPPVAKAHPMPITLPPANRPPLPANAARPPPPPAPPQPPHIRPNSNEARPLESMSEEEARAERKRRQQRAQEEFRKKHQQGHDPAIPVDAMVVEISRVTVDIFPKITEDCLALFAINLSPDEKPSNSSASFDNFLMEIPTQDIEIVQTGEDTGKRKSPVQEGSAKKRHTISRLDIVTD